MGMAGGVILVGMVQRDVIVGFGFWYVGRGVPAVLRMGREKLVGWGGHGLLRRGVHACNGMTRPGAMRWRVFRHLYSWRHDADRAR